ncbi:MAG: hypothetical protein M1114_05710 [Candidatus Dependentiae bacterium]|nr:hypothetical protein [Candidatus Dependentiae bacterium]
MKNLVSIVSMIMYVALSSFVYAMDHKSTSSLSKKEISCYVWYKEQKQKYAPKLYEDLTQEQKIIMKGSNPNRIAAMYREYVDLFFQKLEQNNAPDRTSYSNDSIYSTLLKMRYMIQARKTKPVNILTAKMHVYSRFLTAADRAAMHSEHYKKDEQSTIKIVKKYSELVVEQLINLGLVSDTPEMKQNAVDEMYKEKMEEISGTVE